jgi:hypothetical protein
VLDAVESAACACCGETAAAVGFAALFGDECTPLDGLDFKMSAVAGL